MIELYESSNSIQIDLLLMYIPIVRATSTKFLAKIKIMTTKNVTMKG